MKTRIAPLLLALCSLAATRTAHAQAELTGTYITVLGTRANGTMINAANHSMAYRTATTSTPTCDVFGTVYNTRVEGFTIDYTAGSAVRLSNSVTASAIPTSTPALHGAPSTPPSTMCDVSRRSTPTR